MIRKQKIMLQLHSFFTHIFQVKKSNITYYYSTLRPIFYIYFKYLQIIKKKKKCFLNLLTKAPT